MAGMGARADDVVEDFSVFQNLTAPGKGVNLAGQNPVTTGHLEETSGGLTNPAVTPQTGNPVGCGSLGHCFWRLLHADLVGVILPQRTKTKFSPVLRRDDVLSARASRVALPGHDLPLPVPS